jgi:hypothetical protein
MTRSRVSSARSFSIPTAEWISSPATLLTTCVGTQIY